MTPSQHPQARPETTPERFAADLATARGPLSPWVAGRLAALADDPSLTDAERGARLRAYVAAWDTETRRRTDGGSGGPRWSSQAGLASFAPLTARSDPPPARLTCCRCHRSTGHDRHGARLAGWEPASTRTQRDLDAGPLLCPDCLAAAITDALSLARALGLPR